MKKTFLSAFLIQNKVKIVFILALFQTTLGLSQSTEYVYRNPKDSSYNCYLLIIPDSIEIKGMVIRDYSRLPDISKKSRYKWGDLALKNGLAVLYTVTSNYFPELYLDDTGPILLDEITHEVVLKHSIPKTNIFIGGISASGTRALRFTQFCEQGKSKYGIKIKAAFAVDSPLDNERFYLSARKHMGNFKEGMLEEAKMMVKVFPEKLGGTPDKSLKSYTNSSVFSYTDSAGGNAKYFKGVSLLIFHEPDIDWWLNERGATYFDINSYDIAAFVNKLRLLGNNDVELITTTGRGFDKNGHRNCHSWTIVNEDYLIHWILKHIDD